MKISMIAAMAKNRIIGKENKMPWHLPADLKHFKSVTMGKPVLMGRKTYESIGKALPGRKNIVVTSNQMYRLKDAVVVDSIDVALSEAAKDAEEVMVIGGGTIYKALLENADRLYLTFIDLEVAGDTQFPDYQLIGSWEEVNNERHLADEKNPYNYEFVTLERIR